MGGKVDDISSDNKYGEPRKFDPNFKGPIKDRGCTDVLCSIIFLICIIGMIAVGILGYVRGDPEKLLYPTDSDGNICGINEFSDRPYLFFFDLVACADVGTSVVNSGCPTPQVCVEKCPTKYFTWATAAATNDKSDLICKEGFNKDTTAKSIAELVRDEDCAAYYVESDDILGRCVPKIFTDLADELTDAVKTSENETIVDKFNKTISKLEFIEGSKYLAQLLNAFGYGVKMYQDVRATWWMILIALAASMVISFLWIILMRWIAGPMVWITLVLFLGLFSFTTYYTFNRYVEIKDDPEASLDISNVEFTTDLDYYNNLSVTWLVLGCISAVFLAIILIILIFLRTRILIAIALIKASSKAVGSMMFTLLWPLIPFVLQICVFVYWGAAAIYLASMGEAEYSETNVTSNATVDEESTTRELGNKVLESVPCNENDSTTGDLCNFVKYGGEEYSIYLQVYNLFMWFWLMNFIVALSHITLAGSFASYYWAFKKPDDIPVFPVSASLWRAVRYHLGSLAFGSLIIAIIQLIRVFLEYLDHKLKGSGNKAAQFLLKCLKCCFWCLEKFMKFLNKNAYIMIAVYGKNFCTSAKDAFFLIMRNIVRVVVLDKVTDFLLLIGKLMVVGAVATAAFFFFDGRLPYIDDYIERPELSFVLVPVILIAVGSYIIASAFFGVYSMAVDTLFLCFLEDLERNDGSAEKPYFMSKELMGILGKKNDPEVEAAKD